MHLPPPRRWFFLFALCLFALPAAADPSIRPDTAMSDIMRLFESSQISETILEAAKSLFWSLAVISLVWTMGMLIVRQDIGELLMELLRFIVVTGIFYWILVNASSRQGGQGFVEDIVLSFLRMVNDDSSDDSIRTNADDILRRCLHVFFMVINETGEGQGPDRIIIGGLAIMILCMGAIMTAQFLVALVMAWILGYAGIFLLGFGGARWTSPIAVNYYKHVVAVGIAMLALSVIGAITVSFINELGLTPNGRVYSEFQYLGLMLAVMILMQALAIKVPQLLYTLVTGSTLGLYAGSASAAGTAIAIAGSSAYSTAVTRFPGSGGAGGSVSPSGAPGGATNYRTESVMDAVQRSASVAGGMADPFHVSSGADPFGVARAPDPHRSGGRRGSVFGDVQTATSVPTSEVPTLDTTTGAAGASPSATVGGRVVSKGGTVHDTTREPAVGASGEPGSSAVAAGAAQADIAGTDEAGVDHVTANVSSRDAARGGTHTTQGVTAHRATHADVREALHGERGPLHDVTPGATSSEGLRAASGSASDPADIIDSSPSEGVRTGAGPVSDNPTATDVAFHKDGGIAGAARRPDAVGAEHRNLSGASRMAEGSFDTSLSTDSNVDVHAVGTASADARATAIASTGTPASQGDMPLPAAHGESPSATEPMGTRLTSTPRANAPGIATGQAQGRAPSSTAHSGTVIPATSLETTPPSDTHVSEGGAASTTVGDSGEAPDASAKPAVRSAASRATEAHGAPIAPIIQEDMKPGTPGEDVVDVLPGATTMPPAPDVDGPAEPTTPDAVEDQPTRHGKRRVRRRTDDGLPTSPSPDQAIPDVHARHDDEPPKDEPT